MFVSREINRCEGQARYLVPAGRPTSLRDPRPRGVLLSQLNNIGPYLDVEDIEKAKKNG